MVKYLGSGQVFKLRLLLETWSGIEDRSIGSSAGDPGVWVRLGSRRSLFVGQAEVVQFETSIREFCDEEFLSDHCGNGGRLTFAAVEVSGGVLPEDGETTGGAGSGWLRRPVGRAVFFEDSSEWILHDFSRC